METEAPFISDEHRRFYEVVRQTANKLFAHVAEAENHSSFHKRIHKVITDLLGKAIHDPDVDEVSRKAMVTIAVCFVEGYFHGSFDAGEAAPFATVKSKALDYVSEGLSLLVRGLKEPDKVSDEIISKMSPEQAAEAMALLAKVKAKRQESN